MKTIKSFLFTLIMFISFPSTAATSLSMTAEKDPFSEEISRMLSRSSLIIEKDFTIKVLFILNDDMEIEIRSISSSNERANKFLRARLSGQQLKGANWDSNKVYELPVRVKAIR